MFEIMDKTDWKVAKLILNEPFNEFYLREISTRLQISPSSTKKALDKLNELKLIKEKKKANLRIISGNSDEIVFKQLKIIFNIKKLENLIEKLKPAINITLYGSFAKGENAPSSDIDLFILSNKKKKNPSEYKGFELEIKEQTPAQWNKTKKENQAFANEVKKGITLFGEKLE